MNASSKRTAGVKICVLCLDATRVLGEMRTPSFGDGFCLPNIYPRAYYDRLLFVPVLRQKILINPAVNKLRNRIS